MCVSVRLLQREQGHYYGYVYFRQVRDKSLKRGYFQKVSERSHFSSNKPKMCQHVKPSNDIMLMPPSTYFGSRWDGNQV